MADEKISALTAATSWANADITVIVQGGADKKITKSLILTAGAGEDIALKADGAHASALVSADGNTQIGVANGGGAMSSDGGFFIHSLVGTTDETFGNGTTGWEFQTDRGFTVKNFAGGSGTMVQSMSANTWTVSGFTSVFLQVVLTNHVWATGDPPDAATAIDRLAAAVSGLLGGNIP